MNKLCYLILVILIGTFMPLHAEEFKVNSDPAFNKLITFAGYIEASLENEDPSFFNKNFDVDLFIKNMLNKNQFDLSEAFAKGFVEELKNGLDFGTSIAAEIQKGGSYTFLNADYKDNTGEILFRFLSSQTINYHKLYVKFVEKEPKITDIYVFQSGEKMSESIGRLYSAFISGKENTGDQMPVKWLFYLEYQKLYTLISEGKYKKAHKKLLNLPEEIRRDRLFQIMDIQVASNLDKKTFNSAYGNYINHFPENPGKYLIPLDGLIVHDEFLKALKCIDRLDESVGTDPLLDLLRGNIYYNMNKYETAEKKLSSLIDVMPEFENGYYNLLTIYIEQQKFSEATHLLDDMIGIFNYYKEDFQPLLANYPAFINSSEYKNWIDLSQGL